MDLYISLLVLGGLFFVGLLVDEVGRKTRLPRVTMLILLGLVSGPVGLDILPGEFENLHQFLMTVALSMVAFLLGGSLSRKNLESHGRQIIVISIMVVFITMVVVGGGMIALGVPLVVSLLLAGIATATAPAATYDVLNQANASGGFADTLKGIVAIDDAWGLIVFSFILAIVSTINGAGALDAIAVGAWEILGAILVGLAIGFPAAMLTGRINQGEPMQSEALAVVFVCAGVAIWLEVSFLLAGVVTGAVIVNFARHHKYAFHEIEQIQWPFMILFFFLAGASLKEIGWENNSLIIVSYIVLRVFSRLAGGWAGSRASKAPSGYGRWMGLALMPQAGVAIGMALVAGSYFPEFSDTLLTVTIVAAIVFEIYGPFATRAALDAMRKKGE